MTDEENEQIPKLKVMTSSDAAKARADAIIDDEKKEIESLNAVEGKTDESPKSESVQEEEPIKYYQPEPEVRTSRGIGPSEHTSESERTSRGIRSSSNSESDPIVIGSLDNDDSFDMPAKYVEESEEKKKPKINMNLSSDNARAAIKGMFSFFTIKKQDVNQTEIDAMDNNFHFVPIVGAAFGAVLMIEMFILYLLNYYVNFPLGPVIAITALGTVLIGSKFLHFDGLVDFGDGLIASGDQEKHIAAMKDTSIGAGGMGLALVVILATLAIYSFAGGWNDPMFFALFFIIPATEILIKNSMACAAATGTSGDGMASNQVKKADTDTMFKSTGISAIILIIRLLITTAIIWIMNWVHLHYHTSQLIGNFAFYVTALFIAIVIGLLVSMVIGTMMSKLADRTFGSTTGDVLGATNEIARPIISAAMLLIFLIFIRVLNMI